MTNNEAICVVKMKRTRPRPCPPEIQKIYKKLLDLRRNNPEQFKLEMAKTDENLAKWKQPKPIIEDPETRRIRRADMFKRNGPVKVDFIPQTIRDTSEAYCYTESEAKAYMDLANADPNEMVFKVLNPATELPDEDFTTCVINRYRKNQCDKSSEVDRNCG